MGVDALSPSGSLLYLLQYRGSPWAINASYAVRAYNLDTHRLYPGAIVDRREPDEKMTGQPVTRIEPVAWAYTLYSRTGKRPFLHALDTAHRRAFCVTCRGGSRRAGSISSGCASAAARCSFGAAAR